MNDTMEERRQALDTFAQNGSNSNSPLTAMVRPLAAPADRVFGAQHVAVFRDEARILQKLQALGAAAGTDWFYRFPVRKKGGGQDHIEGPSIKLANDVARIYGNCDVDTRVIDLGDTWIFYARFTDFETGYSLTRPYQQRKSQTGMRTDNDRALDIAFQIGASKAIRNVVVNALQTFSDFAFEAARNSLVEKIGKDIKRYRERTIDGVANLGVELVRVETAIGRKAADWTAPDIAKIIAMGKAIQDGMATLDETFPPIGAKTDAAAAEAGDGDLDDFANKTDGQPKADQASPQGSPPPNHGPAAGQPAPGPSSQAAPTSSAKEAASGAGAAPDGGAGAKEGGATAKPGQKPTTAAAYSQHAAIWRENLIDADAGMTRWKAEKDLRNRCNVPPEEREKLEGLLRVKIAALLGAEKE